LWIVDGNLAILEVSVNAIILFLSTGLFVYWVAILIVRGSEQELSRTLDADLRWGKRLVMTVRAALMPPERT
jgi:hypothetical protein